MKSQGEAVQEMLDWFSEGQHWIQDEIGVEDSQGNVIATCLVGGMQKVFYGCIETMDNYPEYDPMAPDMAPDDSFSSLLERVTRIIGEQYPDRIGGSRYVPSFNDHPETTLADIRTVLEKARAELQEEG